MRELVKCNNCNIKWQRVIAYGDSEFNWDLQYNCPSCGSNWYEPTDKKVRVYSDEVEAELDTYKSV